MPREESAADRAPVVQNNKPDMDTARVSDWLKSHIGSSVTNVQPLAGGFWSAAFAYDCGDEEFVVRFNHNPEGFRIDAAAHDFSGEGLPIPEVFEIGTALELSYAISRRHHGRFLETVEAEAAPQLALALAELFSGLRRVPARERVEWYNPASKRSWHDYLLRGISEENGNQPQNQMQQALESRPALNGLYRSGCQRIHELLPLCPERRDLVHGDLLHQNVLVSGKADSVRAVFSWKCSAFGDFVYDIAWCTHWAPWHPGIAAIDLFNLLQNADDLDTEDRRHIAERHHCYELQIAASHIGWYLWTRDEENLALLVSGLQARMDRGPLALN